MLTNGTIEIELPAEISEPILKIRELLEELPPAMRLGFLSGSVGVTIRDNWSPEHHEALSQHAYDTIRLKLTRELSLDAFASLAARMNSMPSLGEPKLL
jgi:hypothetical protein